MVEMVRRHLGLGLLAMLLSCAAFGTSGPFAKALMTAGWTPGAVVLTRISGAALAPPAVHPLGPARPLARGRATSCPASPSTARSPWPRPSSATSRPSTG